MTRDPITAERLARLRSTCERALTYWAGAPPDDDEAAENAEFYGDVLAVIDHYRPVGRQPSTRG